MEIIANGLRDKRLQIRVARFRNHFFSAIFMNKPKPGLLSELQPHGLQIVINGDQTLNPGKDVNHNLSWKENTQGCPDSLEPHPFEWSNKGLDVPDGKLLKHSSETTSTFLPIPYQSSITGQITQKRYKMRYNGYSDRSYTTETIRTFRQHYLVQ